MTIAFIAILAFKYEFSVAFSQMNAFPLRGIILLLLIYYVTIITSAIKWEILYPHEGLTRVFEVVMIGHFFAMLLPGQLFGEASKVVYLAGEAKRSGVTGRVEVLAASVVVDKITGLTGLIIIGITGAVFGSRLEHVQYLPFYFIAMLAGLSFLLICLRFHWCCSLVDRICVFCETKLPRTKRVVASLRRVVGAWKLYLNFPVKLAVSILMGIIYQAMIVGIHIILCRYLNISVSFFDLCWICAFQAIIVLLPVTIAGIGLREGGYVGMLGLLGIPASSSLALSLSIFSLQIIGALIGGAFVMKNSITRGMRS